MNDRGMAGDGNVDTGAALAMRAPGDGWAFPRDGAADDVGGVRDALAAAG